MSDSEPNVGWRVERHGGRRGDGWRLVYEGEEERARREYEKLYEAMRQGGVRLLQPGGRTELITTSPRLRTRW
jgi:hypothetical protein